MFKIFRKIEKNTLPVAIFAINFNVEANKK